MDFYYFISQYSKKKKKYSGNMTHAETTLRSASVLSRIPSSHLFIKSEPDRFKQELSTES